MTDSSFTYRERACRLIYNENAKIAFLLGTGTGGNQEARAIYDICTQSSSQPFGILSYESCDWNADYSPWFASTGGTEYAGGGSKTLSWLIDMCQNCLSTQGFKQFYPVGYSLAGLFALWAFYEGEIFDGALSCSGSLWYPNFTEYARAKTAKPNSVIYLSLGGREEASAPEHMKSVGANTREMLEIVKRDKNVSDCALEMNKGGHFAPSAPRLSKAILKTLSFINEARPQE